MKSGKNASRPANKTPDISSLKERKNDEKIFLSLILLGFSSGVALADTTVQSCNRTVTFDAPPERAISNDVNLTEMMLVLGLAERMVGYTGISGWKTLDEEM